MYAHLGHITTRIPLSHICLCPDAQKKTNGLPPVAPDVVTTVLCDELFWPRLKQLTRVIKPLVNTIGNFEAQDTSLADCMLEFICCARAMICIPSEPDDDVGFMIHARSVFNQRFHSWIPTFTLSPSFFTLSVKNLRFLRQQMVGHSNSWQRQLLALQNNGSG
jgi:hypothetical protein